MPEELLTSDCLAALQRDQRQGSTMALSRHQRQEPAGGSGLGALAAALALLGSAVAPAHAGSVTVSSIWDRDHALQQARQQLPAGAVITREHCQDVEVGFGNYHYLCTVEFSEAPPGESSAPVP
jgi:hypothetical protein